MKKLYAMLLAGVLAVSLTVPVLAAPSPSAKTVEKSAAVLTGVSGVTAAVASETLSAEVVRVTSDAQVLSDLGIPANARLAQVVDVQYSGTIPAGGVQIPFNIFFAKPGDMVYILHRQPNAPYTWEVVGKQIMGNDYTVTGTFTSFSPVAFMVVDAANVASGEVKAPKTGDMN